MDQVVITGVPLVSVIIPAYNAEKHIAETLRSVVDQTVSDWEIFVIDDGSTDATKEIVRPFLSDPRIHYSFQENAGVSTARNTGLDMATGNYISFLDADDVWGSDNLERKIQAIVKNSADYSFSDLEEIDENSQNIGWDHRKGAQELKNILEWKTVLGPPSNLVISKHCFSDGLRFDPAFSTAADQDFGFQLAKDFKGIHLEIPLLRYRVLENSMSRNIRLMEHDHIGVFRKASQVGLFSSYFHKLHCFSNLYLVLAGSWWKNGHNKTRALFFLIRALFIYPPNNLKLLKKLF